MGMERESRVHFPESDTGAEIAAGAGERAWPAGHWRWSQLAGPAEGYKVVGVTGDNW